jgi:hypothetical protein
MGQGRVLAGERGIFGGKLGIACASVAVLALRGVSIADLDIFMMFGSSVIY